MSPRLSYERVSCRRGRKRAEFAALHDFSLACAAGEAICLIGPNGAGKSTALALAAGLLPATAGRVTFADRTVSPSAPPRRLGYLPQESAFPSRLTVAEVLELTAAARAAEAAALRAAFSAAGFEPLRDRPIGSLSSGWLRRLGLAVALMPPADLLLLDEPFVGVDLETLDRLVDDLRQRVAEGAALLLCSHDFEVVDRLGARAAVLDEGRLLVVTEDGGEGARAAYRRALRGAGREAEDADTGEGSGLYAVAG